MATCINQYAVINSHQLTNVIHHYHNFVGDRVTAELITIKNSSSGF